MRTKSTRVRFVSSDGLQKTVRQGVRTWTNRTGHRLPGYLIHSYKGDHHLPAKKAECIINKARGFRGWISKASSLHHLKRMIQKTQHTKKVRVNLIRFYAVLPCPHKANEALKQTQKISNEILSRFSLDYSTPSWELVAKSLIKSKGDIKKAVIAVVSTKLKILTDTPTHLAIKNGTGNKLPGHIKMQMELPNSYDYAEDSIFANQKGALHDSREIRKTQKTIIFCDRPTFLVYFFTSRSLDGKKVEISKVLMTPDADPHIIASKIRDFCTVAGQRAN